MSKPKHCSCVAQEIDGVAVQYRNQCIEGVTFVCNGAQDNNCNDGEATVRQWQIAFYNFDNFASSLLSVVEVAVMDNYMDDVAYFVMDATGSIISCPIDAFIAYILHTPIRFCQFAQLQVIC